MQEDVTREGDEISVNVDVEAGEFVRRRGCDLAEGQIILAQGERIRAATIALLASQGFADVTVGGEATAAIISTGDELVHTGQKTCSQDKFTTAIRHCSVRSCNGAVRARHRWNIVAMIANR